MSAKKITITMSEQAPVTVDPEAWPLIASAETYRGAVRSQANEEWEIEVREHADGRRIVYGWRDRGNGGMPIDYRGVRAGYLLAAGDDTVRAIRRVAGVIGDEQLGAECIADLPAVEL